MLDQGVLEAAAQPIDCATDCASPQTPPTTQYRAGGCGCRLASEEERNATAMLLLFVGLGAAAAKRRRGRRIR